MRVSCETGVDKNVEFCTFPTVVIANLAIGGRYNYSYY